MIRAPWQVESRAFIQVQPWDVHLRLALLLKNMGPQRAQMEPGFKAEAGNTAAFRQLRS